MADDRYPESVHARASEDMEDHETRFMAALSAAGAYRGSPNMDVAMHGDEVFYVEASEWMDKGALTGLWNAIEKEGLDYETCVIVVRREKPSTGGDGASEEIYPGDGHAARMYEFVPGDLADGEWEYGVSLFLEQDPYVFADNAYEDMLGDGSLTREEMNAWLESNGRGYRV